MRVSDVKYSGNRMEIRDLSSLAIQTYGADNLYPQRLYQITKASSTAGSCIERYGKFIRGRGFSDMKLYNYVVNRFGLTADKLVRKISEDIARYYGFALHVNYNLFCELTEIQHVPFEHARLGLEDDNGYIGKIALNKDWSGKRKKRASQENTDYVDVFNPDKAVVAAQIQAAGGIDRYKGQVLWVSLEGEYTYPTPKYDGAITDISTDEGLSNVKYRNVRNNFFPSGILVTKRGTSEAGPDGQLTIGFDATRFKQFQGDTEACKVVHVEVDHGEEMPEFKEFPSKSFDKDFTVTEQSTVERIYASFGQEAFYRVRTGALGLSAEIISEAFRYYNSFTTDERLIVEETFAQLFSHWYETPPTDNFSISELLYIKSDTMLAQIIGVGGLVAAKDILMSDLSQPQKVNALRFFFNSTKGEAEALVYGTEMPEDDSNG
jgi:hypothetical protein